MIKVVKVTTPKFTPGDKVQFSIIDRPDNYSPGYKTMYGYASKINRLTMEILGVDGERYVGKISEVKLYVNPFGDAK